MDIDTILKITESGGNAAVIVVIWLLWKMDKAIAEFLAEIRGQQDGRDKKLDSIHRDIGAMIRKLAGMNGSANQ